MISAHSCHFFRSHSLGLMTTRFFRGILQDRKTERDVEVLDNSAVMVKAREAEKEGPHVICNRGTRAYPCHGVNWGSEEEAQRTSILHMFISQSFLLGSRRYHSVRQFKKRSKPFHHNIIPISSIYL